MASPLHAKQLAENGTPAADCGYTSTPCGVCVNTLQNKKIKVTIHFVFFHILY